MKPVLVAEETANIRMGFPYFPYLVFSPFGLVSLLLNQRPQYKVDLLADFRNPS